MKEKILTPEIKTIKNTTFKIKSFTYLNQQKDGYFSDFKTRFYKKYSITAL